MDKAGRAWGRCHANSGPGSDELRGRIAALLARLGETALASFFAEGHNQIVLDLSLNLRMLLFTLSVAVVSGLALGIVPAMRTVHLDPAAGLPRDSPRSQIFDSITQRISVSPGEIAAGHAGAEGEAERNRLMHSADRHPSML